MPLWLEWETFEVLRELNRKARHARVPPPFEKVVAEWQRGNLPPRPPEGEPWPEAHTARFKV